MFSPRAIASESISIYFLERPVSFSERCVMQICHASIRKLNAPLRDLFTRGLFYFWRFHSKIPITNSHRNIRSLTELAGVLPNISYIGMCGAKGHGFWALLAWKRVQWKRYRGTEMSSKNREARKIEGKFPQIFVQREQKAASNNREAWKIEGSKNKDFGLK